MSSPDTSPFQTDEAAASLHGINLFPASHEVEISGKAGSKGSLLPSLMLLLTLGAIASSQFFCLFLKFDRNVTSGKIK